MKKLKSEITKLKNENVEMENKIETMEGEMNQYKKENDRLKLQNIKFNILINIFKKKWSTIKEKKDYIQNYQCCECNYESGMVNIWLKLMLILRKRSMWSQAH